MQRHPLPRWLCALLTVFMAVLVASTAARAANVAAGKPAYATINPTTASNVTDNNLGTSWDDTGSLGFATDWIAVDLGAATTMKTVKIYWSINPPVSFNVDTATHLTTDPNDPNYLFDGDWTTQATYTAPSPGATPNPTVLTVNASARFIRIAPNDTNGAVWGVSEFQVFDVTLPTLSGTVTAGGSPVTGTQVILNGPTGPTSTTQSTLTDTSTGAYSFAGLEPGSYTLTAYYPGKYAPVSAPVTVAASNLTQNVSFTTPVTNSTAVLPTYNRDIAAGSGTTDADAGTTVNFPAEEWPGPSAGGVWDPAATPPAGLTLGASMPKNTKIALGPTTTGADNVMNADQLIIPFSPAHYAALYILQTATDGMYYTTATLNYADGTSQQVTTASGNNVYQFTRGDNNTGAGEDEVLAFQSDTGVDISNGGATTGSPFSVYLRTIRVDSTKVLSNITFDGNVGGTGSNTLSKGFVLGWSADSLDTPPAYGSIAGTIKSPTGVAVPGALAQFLNYKQTTTTGAYKFNSVPQGTWNITASKPASYAPLTKPATLTAGQNLTLDIQFTTGINVVATGLGSPSVDLVSSDANYPDFFATGWMPGREYYPTGLYKPDMGSDPNGKYTVAGGAPGGLTFNFVDYGDTPIAPGQPGYPVGGTPNVQLLQGGVFLAPPAKITNAYFAITGAEGGTLVSPTLTYTDGTTETKVLSVSDWFGTPTADELPYLLMRGRHDRTGEANVGANIRLNVLPVAVNPNKTLKQIEFYRAQNYPVFPLVYAVAWETDPSTTIPAPVDVTVNVKTAGGAAAPGAIVTLGPYNIRADANGQAIFRGLPVGLSLGLGAFVSGQTQQARNETFQVPATSGSVNISLPAAAPNYVPLSLDYDYDAIAMADMPGDFKTGADNDYGFVGENLPASGATVTVAGVPYLMPHKETFYNNTMRMNGQVIPVVPGHYSAFDMVLTGFGLGGDHTNILPLKLHYADGTTEQVTMGAQDWINNWPSPDISNNFLFWRMVNPGSNNPFYSPTRRNQNEDQALNSAFLPQVTPVNAGKVLQSIEFLPMPGQLSQQDIEVLAATLESNDQVAGGTITGTVSGQPLGATSAKGLPMTQVILDAGHAAYTDANGNFTITNAPVGAGNLTVIPYGTGILTKTFPVTVAAGANNAGTLNVGAGVNQISITLGPNNSGSGLQQVEGYPSPYGLTVPFSQTVAGTVGGQTERTGIVNGGVNDVYFRVDPGWLWRGLQGNNGLDITTLSGTTPKLAPHLYMQVQYYDQGSNTVEMDYDKMEVATHAALGVTGIRITNPRAKATPTVAKAGSNSWKTTVLDLNPTVDPFGAYKGIHLETDFRFRGIPTDAGFQVTPFHSVIISTTNSFVQPISAKDILAVAGGLAAAPAKTDPAFASMDLNNDGKIDLRDAVLSQRKANGL